MERNETKVGTQQPGGSVGVPEDVRAAVLAEYSQAELQAWRDELVEELANATAALKRVRPHASQGHHDMCSEDLDWSEADRSLRYFDHSNEGRVLAALRSTGAGQSGAES